MFDVLSLDKAIRAVAPIDGISIGDYTDKTTWRIAFQHNSDGTIIATVDQQNAALAVIQNFSIDNVLFNQDIQNQIDIIEASITNRRLREAFINTESPSGWLATQNTAIAALRAQLKPISGS